MSPKEIAEHIVGNYDPNTIGSGYFHHVIESHVTLARAYLEAINYQDFLAKEMTARISEIAKLKKENESLRCALDDKGET